MNLSELNPLSMDLPVGVSLCAPTTGARSLAYNNIHQHLSARKPITLFERMQTSAAPKQASTCPQTTANSRHDVQWRPGRQHLWEDANILQAFRQDRLARPTESVIQGVRQALQEAVREDCIHRSNQEKGIATTNTQQAAGQEQEIVLLHPEEKP